MTEFLEMFRRHAQERGDCIAVVDRDGRRNTTYARLNDISDRIATYLIEKGVGRDDTVAISLTREMEYVACILGVMKAGAAYVPLEDHLAVERKNYIIKDCACKYVFDVRDIGVAMRRPRIAEWVEADEHDLGLIIYTSGSTGNPKGVMQEYGVFDYMWKSVYEQNADYLGEPGGKVLNVALISPMMFVASAIVMNMAIYHGSTIHVISMETVRNLPVMIRYFQEHQIDTTFMTSSLAKQADKIPGLSLGVVFIGAELVTDLYSDKYRICNCYSMSETGCVSCLYKIDQAYPVTPVGYPLASLKPRLINENREPAEKAGVLCLKLKYFRGYRNLPEKTEEAFIEIDNERYFITGDIAEIDDQDRYIIKGRSDDMIKIRGNRVEPGEVEGAIERCFPDITMCSVKGFKDPKTGNYLCAYYVAKREIDPGEFRKKLEKEITAYMMPSFFVKMADLPRTATGKIAKGQLPAPDHAEQRAEYCAPSGPLEEELCRAMGEALGIEKFSATEDFIALGGDSLAIMGLVADTRIQGLSFKEIVEGRTPRKIAELCEKNGMTVGEKDSVKVVHHSSYRLRAIQSWLFDLQLIHPKSTAWNLPFLIRLGKDSKLDRERLLQCFKEVIAAHEVFGTRFYFDLETGYLRQKFVPVSIETVSPETTVEHVSEEQMEEILETLVQPYRLTDSDLFRLRAFDTGDDFYIYFDVHHSIIDGTSFTLVFREIVERYEGREIPKAEIDFEDIIARELMTDPAVIKEDTRFWMKELSRFSEEKYLPAKDHETGLDEDDELFLVLEGVTEDLVKASGESENVFFMTASLLAQAAYLDQNEAFMCWIYNGRDTAEKIEMIGLLICQLPLYISLAEDRTIVDLMEEVKGRIQEQMQHLNGTAQIYESMIVDNAMTFLFQQDMRSAPVIEGEELEVTDDLPGVKTATNTLDLELLKDDDGYVLMMDYDCGLYKEETIMAYGTLFEKASQLMLQNPQASTGAILKELKALKTSTEEK